MAKDTKATKPARGEKKPAKEKQPRFARLKQIVQVFRMSRQLDPRMPYWMAIAFLGTAAILFLAFTLLGSPLFLTIPITVLGSLLALMIVFSRRVQKAQFNQIDGQPGAAGWVLDNMRGGWRVTQGVGVTGQLDVVHRVLGRPGVILVGEGVPGRVKGLLPGRRRGADLRRHDRRGGGSGPAAQAQPAPDRPAAQSHPGAGDRAGEAARRARRHQGAAGAQGPDAPQRPDVRPRADHAPALSTLAAQQLKPVRPRSG
jgi:Domain of unknown function (DUF4191)